MIIAAFTALYLIWGSTYLGMKVAIETIPPFLMSMSRFMIAGAILYTIARLTGAPRPQLSHWIHSIIVGGLLILGGNGLVCYAETSVDSSLAALIVASNPFFMAIFGWWAGVQRRPSPRAWLSLIGGFAGVAILVSYGNNVDLAGNPAPYIILTFAVLLWTGGSIYSKKYPQTISPWLQSGMQMFCGGFFSLIASLTLGEFDTFDIAAVSTRSWLAYSYLLIIGSLVGFTSYVYLLKNCSASAVSSHAYVNPVVAVILGWLILGEVLSTGGIIGSALILISVYLLLRSRHEPKQPSPATNSPLPTSSLK